MPDIATRWDGGAVSQRGDEYRRLSFWHDSVPGSLEPGPSLDGDIEADVAIVGAGLTGMWTAYYLSATNPELKIVLCEREIAGFGASGRNGGWCSALFPASLPKLERMAGRESAIAMHRAMQQTVDEVGKVTADEGIDCHWAKGGTVQFARSEAQMQRAKDEVHEARLYGFDEADLRLLSASEAQEISAMTNVLGGVYTPHCAAIHPARLARGLAGVLRARGVQIYEKTEVRQLKQGQVVTATGTVRARHVIRATEGYTAQLSGYKRAVVPVYSLVVATAPLPASVLEQVGMATRPTFNDLRHMIIYGQRTADGRLVFGGRGAPYHYGSAIQPSFDRVPTVFGALRKTLTELFPALEDVAITHTWGGPLGIPRDWCASVGHDPATGIGWAGGYVGDGLSTTNLAGRTLAHLITGTDSDLTRLPWVGHRSPRWAPEPFRWLGVNGGLRVMTWADQSEIKTGRPSKAAEAFGRFLRSSRPAARRNQPPS
ncbi:MAG TPA: FAD-binding oxidoreductase [Streptosporangiaceae bacterium]|nr:FAD-binding oxidoreductase [Streptosporangiaceae bacterium]